MLILMITIPHVFYMSSHYSLHVNSFFKILYAVKQILPKMQYLSCFLVLYSKIFFYPWFALSVRIGVSTNCWYGTYQAVPSILIHDTLGCTNIPPVPILYWTGMYCSYRVLYFGTSNLAFIKELNSIWKMDIIILGIMCVHEKRSYLG